MIEVHSRALTVDAASVEAALAQLRVQPQVQAHALTRSLLTLQVELMPESMQHARAGGPGEGCSTPGSERARSVDCRREACRLSDFKVQLRIDLMLPEWQPSRRPAVGEQALWQALHARLLAHEQRHREHAEAATQRLHEQLESRLDRVESFDCLRLQTDIEALRHAAIQDLRLRDRIFDQSSEEALQVRRTQR
ncbi:MAG: DUF922 domain-containing Zn-dependent protease [Aquimonas sp.]|nr:DUF922 domain-containing Zn-dependent protease [Aquimonas sp.]